MNETTRQTLITVGLMALILFGIFLNFFQQHETINTNLGTCIANQVTMNDNLNRLADNQATILQLINATHNG